MEQVMERAEDQNMMSSYMAPRRGGNSDARDGNDFFGYVVKGAPWNESGKPGKGAPGGGRMADPVPDAGNDTDFPDLGLKSASSGQGKAWGPWGAN